MAHEEKDQTLAELVAKWNTQKKSERAATSSRVSTEQEIITRLSELDREVPAEGAVTYETPNGFKLTVTTKLNRKIVDTDKLRELQDDIPENLRPWAFVESIKLDARGLRWLYENEPGLAAVCGEFIEEKPAKPGFKVVEV